MHDVFRDFFFWLAGFLCVSAALFLVAQRVASYWRRRRSIGKPLTQFTQSSAEKSIHPAKEDSPIGLTHSLS